MAISLIVGLGNPGADYQKHRHNVGFWFVDLLTKEKDFSLDKKFLGQTSSYQQTKLLKPTTFMNKSGQSVQAMANFYKIAVDEILVVHDELDLISGDIRLKKGGGHGGHNGLRDIIQLLGSADFYRLRIGIDHPGDKRLVANYVLHQPSKEQYNNIEEAMTKAHLLLDDIVAGDFAKVMNTLHTKN